MSYDALDLREQAVARAQWNERMTALRDSLDLAAEFGAAGQGWIDADENGDVVERSLQQVAPKRVPRRRTS